MNTTISRSKQAVHRLCRGLESPASTSAGVRDAFRGHCVQRIARQVLLGVALAPCLASIGCAAENRYKDLASPHVACAPEEMEIQSLKGNARLAKYDVVCSTGEVYECWSDASSGPAISNTTCDSLGKVEMAKAEWPDPARKPETDPEPVAPKQPWTRVTLEACGASALMPNAAKAQDVSLDGIEGQFAVAYQGDHEFHFSCMNVAEAARQKGSEQLLTEAIRGMTQSVGGEVVRLERAKARTDLVLKLPTGHYHRSRLQLRDGWMFITQIDPMEGLEGAEVRDFIDSVEIPDRRAL